jgi:hypothetical protein
MRKLLTRRTGRTERSATPVMFEGLEDRRLMSVSVSASSIDVVEGKFFKTPVATFVSSDPAPFNRANYVVTINWGDGTTSAGRVKADKQHPGHFIVMGHHRYAEAGDFDVSVSVHDLVDSSDDQDNNTATVTDAPLKAKGKQLSSSAAGTAFTKMLASFHDANHLSTASDFTAMVDWGDGSAPEAATIVANGDGSFRVVGTHTYATAGSYVMSITISDNEGSSITVQSGDKAKAPKV